MRATHSGSLAALAAATVLTTAEVNVAGGQAPGQLPPPTTRGAVSVEEALALRRSIRAFAPGALPDRSLGQLLWALQGVTDPGGLRAAPSAGALYPLEIYVVTARGVFHYLPARHALERRHDTDVRGALQRAALDQPVVGQAPAVFVIAAVHGRTARRYGEARTPRYVHLEAGHAAQNLLLQAVALGLGAVPVGAFHDARVREILALPDDQEPIYLIPVGFPRR